MEERRRLKRRYLRYYGRVYDARGSGQIGNLVDITEKGAMILTDRPLPVNQILNLRLELTADIAHQPFLEFVAKSVWCQPDLDHRHYNTGLEIIGLTANGEDIIRRIVALYGFRDNELSADNPTFDL